MNPSSKAGSAHRVIIADDHPLFRTALSQAVSQALGEPELLTVGSVDELTALLADSNGDADLLLLDLNMPGARGYSALVHARSVALALPVIVVSAHERRERCAGIARSWRRWFHSEVGVAGNHGRGHIGGFIRAALDSRSRRERRARQGRIHRKTGLAHAAAATRPHDVDGGLLNKQIAIDLDISEATVKAHITAILRKLDVHTRTQAVIAARSLEIDWGNYARRELNDSNS